MAGLKNEKDKEKDKTVVAENTNSIETNVNNETTNTEVAENTNSTETNVNSETGNTEVVTQNQVITEVKTESKKEDKTYIYIGEELTKDRFILKHKGFYTSEQLKRIETGISDYDEIKENFIDLDEYSEDK